MKVENLTNDRNNVVRNQFVIRMNGNTYFQSYDTMICRISKKGIITVSEYWNYSNTTMKHLYIFLRDYAYMKNVQSKKDIIRLLKEKKIRLVKKL